MVGMMPHLMVLGATTASPFLWYVTRALAVMAYVALTGMVIVGQIRTIVRRLGDPIPWILDEIHSFMSVLVVLLTLGHVLVLLVDPFLTFALINLIIPANEPYRPQAVNYGVFALYGMALVACSSWLRRALPYATWRFLHYAGFVTFALVTIHGFTAGSDANEPFMRAIYVAGVVAVGSLTIVRMVVRPGATSKAVARSGRG